MFDLLTALRNTASQALDTGALEPIETEVELLHSAGVSFAVRTIVTKRTEARVRRKLSRPGNPFLPYDERLFVADVSDNYVCLLNKFNVMENHMLLVTKGFEEQTDALNEVDFDAIAKCLDQVDGLGFYNSGPEAGASQRHKHLQLVPFPLAKLGHGLLIRDEAELPFHCLEATIGANPTAMAKQYQEMLAELGLLGSPPKPYNLLMTREWMGMVPRTREYFQTISINGLGYAGSLFARNEAERQMILEHGPMSVLTAVTGTEGES